MIRFLKSLRSLRVAGFMARKAIMRTNIGVTVLTVFILVLVALNLLFTPGLLNGVITSANNKLISTYSSHLVIEAGGLKEQNFKINHVSDLMQKIESINGVVAATARNTIGANIKYKDSTDQERQINCIVDAIIPDREERVFDIKHSLIEGSYLDDRDRDQILLGVQLAGADDNSVELYIRSLRHVHAGDKVTVTYSNGFQKQYTVKGIFHTAFIQSDAQAHVSELEYESIVPGAHDTATELHVKLDNNADPDTIIKRIAMFDNSVDFQTWEQNAGIVNSMTTSFQILNRILDVVNALVAGVTIFIVTYVDVINKRRQIGIQRAIGIKKVAIMFSYLIRALCYVAVGLIGARFLFEYAVIPFEAGHPFVFPFGPVYLAMDDAQMIHTAVLLLIVSLVAAFIPVWLTIRIKILDAIWG
ncbi:MAG: ABC transporter permease [Dehalococcoidia bacterium]|jgi:putative ABC transport system permease protein